MKKLFYTIIILIISLTGFVFTYQNPQEVTVKFYNFFQWQVQLPIMLISAFVLGVVVGWLFSLIGRFKTRHRLSQAKREVKRTSRELEQLKTSPSRELA